MYRRIIFIVIAVALAAGGTTGVGLYARSADTRALEGQQVIEAYVAVETVPQGTSAEDALANGLIERQQLSRKGTPDGALTEFDDAIQDQVAQARIPAGSLVLRTIFAPREQIAATGGLVIPAGKVAVTVTLQDQQGDPLVIPGLEVGSQVAVFDTFNVFEGRRPKRDPNTPSGDGLSSGFEKLQATRLVIPRAEVIAVGQPGTADDDSQNEDEDSVITLAISQSETERMAQVIATGLASLAMLGPESEIKPGPGVDSENLFDFGRNREGRRQ